MFLLHLLEDDDYMMNEPILTIAIPTYNRHDSLVKLFDSFLKRVVCSQLSGEVEIIVCDNSGHEVSKMNGSLFAGFGINHIINETNLGFSGNVIKCLKEAKGNYLWVISDDDYVDFNAFDKFMKKLPELYKNHVNCIMLPFINHDPFGRSYTCNTALDWGVKPQCTLKGLVDSGDQFPFVLFSSAIINIEKSTAIQLKEVEDVFSTNDYIQIPLFMKVVGMKAKLTFYDQALQEYKTANTIRFNIKKMYSSMNDIIYYYLASNSTLYRKYCCRNYRLWAGWLLWDRSGLVNVPGASDFRLSLAKNLFGCFTFKNFILTILMAIPKMLLKWSYVFYISSTIALKDKRLSIFYIWKNMAEISRKGSDYNE